MSKKYDAQESFPAKCPCCLAADAISFLTYAGKNGKYRQYECGQCKFQFTWPSPSAEEIDLFYSTEEYYSQTAGADSDSGNYTDYDEQTRGALDFFRSYLKSLNLKSGSTLLDVGCAKGRFMEIAAEFGYRCSGVEVSDYAREYVKDYYNGAFQVWKSLKDLPQQERGYDVIILFDVIEHVNSPWDLLLDLFRRGCVGEHTLIVITTPNCQSLKSLKDPGRWCYRYLPAHLSFCAPETFQKIGETLLFRDIKILGHSFMNEEAGSFKEMFCRSYEQYDGLLCQFSGSVLAHFPASEFPEDAAALKEDVRYQKLLVQYLSAKKTPVFNSSYLDHMNDLYNRLSREKENLWQAYHGLEEGNAGLAEEKADLQKDCQLLDSQKNELQSLIEKQDAELAARGQHLYSMWNELLAVQSKRDMEIQEKDSLSRQIQQCTSELEILKRDKNSLSLLLEECSAKLKILEPYKDLLENQVREYAEKAVELNSYRLHLEGQVRELDSYRLHLEEQVRELDSYRLHLEEQVREFSDKLNEVYHSRSYRLGRMITYPGRLCKRILSRIRERSAACAELKKKCGAAYVWKKIFRKLVGKRTVRGYHVISSIGVNREISFHLVRVNGSVDSYPLIWSFIHSLKTLPGLIADPACLGIDREVKHDYSCNMCLYPDLDISFHCKGHADAILGQDGKVDESKAAAERAELKNRLTYLAGKWQKNLSDPECTMLCILTPWEEYSTTEEILSVYEALQQYPRVDLLVVLTGKEKSVKASALRSKGIFVRYISHHPSHDKVTDVDSNDIRGWNCILDEFRPFVIQKSNKVYKYED